MLLGSVCLNAKVISVETLKTRLWNFPRMSFPGFILKGWKSCIQVRETISMSILTEELCFAN